MIRLGVDTGGTFTDFVYEQAGRLKSFKILSSPTNPASAVISGLNEFIESGQKLSLVHGTTVGTNALLERRLPKTALITTRGFEDLLAIGRQNRPELYNLFVTKPRPLVPARLRIGVEERTTVKGEVLLPVNEKELNETLARIKKAKVESLAICFLSSFANPANEMAVLKAARSLAIPVTASHQVLPEFREYERLSTTVINAALVPIMDKYLGTLEQALRGSYLRIMQSNGGSISSGAARAFPAFTIFSGPAAGVIGASEVAKRAGFTDIISFDMGGTSTDVSLIKGQVQTVNDTTVGQLPLKAQVINIRSVGAGGGSIAYLDPGGALRVGPRSAGAFPGPICYGRGAELTVTDANLFLGRMDPDRFLGGTMRLSRERILPYLSRLARNLGLANEEVAQGILDVVNANMERALRLVTVERGHDPRDFTLVCFGGAGGLHACDLASRLSIPRILIPRDPGTLSALGMLMADISRDYSITVLLHLSKIGAGRLKELLRPLMRRAESELRKEPLAQGKLQLFPSADLRYQGQSYELNLPLRLDRLDVSPEDFHRLHLKTYGYFHPGRECELVTLRLRAVTKVRKPELPVLHVPKINRKNPQSGVSKVYFAGKWGKTPTYNREELVPGTRINGPGVIHEYSATHFIPPGFRARVDSWGNLIIGSPKEGKT